MPGKLNVFGLGSLGVNVDKNPINLEDGELTKAQNAIHDASGSMGGIRKRKGLTKVNSVAGAGSIAGAVGVPIAIGTAGNDIPAVNPAIRAYLLARRITATTAGWNTSTDGWTTSPTTGGPDGFDASATPRVPDYVWTGMAETGDTTGHYKAAYSGRPGVMYQNRFYYAGNDYTFQSTAPTIRMWDGARDQIICKIPSRAGTVAEAVVDMIVGGDNLLYLTTHDSGVNSANTVLSRIFQLNPESGALLQLGAGFPISPETVRFPFTLCWHQGRVWARTVGAGISAGSQLVYYFRPGIDTAWTLDATEAFESSNLMFSFQGKLYTAVRKDAAAAALIRVRSSLGVYSTSKTAASDEGGGSPVMAGFGYGNHFGAAASFNGNMYVSYYNSENAAAGTDPAGRYARIYKFDGTSWTLVHSPAADDASCIPYNSAVVLGGRLYFVSAPARTTAVANLNRLLYTTNGSAFTAVTTGILDDVSGGVMGAISS